MKKRLLSLIAAMVLIQGAFAASVKTDRTWYLAGEAMTVSVTADNAIIAYAELCDRQSMAAGIVVSLRRGEGTGVIELPADLHSGYYVLSVYTSDDVQASQQLVAVVNPLRKSADDDIEWVKVTHPDSLSYPATGVGSQTSGFTSNQKLQISNFKFQTIHETEGHILRARVKNVYDGKTFTASQIRPSLSLIGKQIHYFEGKMENDSTAVFYTYDIHGKRPLVLSALSYTGESLPVEMISPFATLLPEQLPHLVFHYQRNEVVARSFDMQRHQKAITPAKRELQIGEYADDTAEEGVPLDYDDNVLGTTPDQSYNLDEYRQFLTIREVLLEYVTCVSSRKFNGLPQLIVRRGHEPFSSALPTLVLIDGMPVVDTEKLLKYDARRIHYINIYGGQYIFGNGVYNGILSFVTRSGRLTNYPIERNMQYLVYAFPE